jgi:hypothetical protein
MALSDFGDARHAGRVNSTPASTDRALLIVLSIVGALVLVALIVVFTRGAPPLSDESTPEGVVQRYVTAVLEGDEQEAAEYLTEDAIKDCDTFFPDRTSDIRVTLVSTTERETSADVRVSIVTSYGDGDPFGGSEYETEDVFDLVKVDGDWVIDLAPWPLSICVQK